MKPAPVISIIARDDSNGNQREPFDTKQKKVDTYGGIRYRYESARAIEERGGAFATPGTPFVT
jgi:hypothetical protein